MPRDKIREITIEGFKAFRQPTTLQLSDMTVLVGENGTGKSSLLQVLEILRQAAFPGRFTDDVLRTRHGMPNELINDQSDCFTFKARVEGAGDPLEYELTIEAARDRFRIQSESLKLFQSGYPKSLKVLERGDKVRFLDTNQSELSPYQDIEPETLAISSFGRSAQPSHW